MKKCIILDQVTIEELLKLHADYQAFCRNGSQDPLTIQNWLDHEVESKRILFIKGEGYFWNDK